METMWLSQQDWLERSCLPIIYISIWVTTSQLKWCRLPMVNIWVTFFFWLENKNKWFTFFFLFFHNCHLAGLTISCDLKKGKKQIVVVRLVCISFGYYAGHELCVFTWIWGSGCNILFFVFFNALQTNVLRHNSRSVRREFILILFPSVTRS